MIGQLSETVAENLQLFPAYEKQGTVASPKISKEM
jgi:hypothetical protein